MHPTISKAMASAQGMRHQSLSASSPWWLPIAGECAQRQRLTAANGVKFTSCGRCPTPLRTEAELLVDIESFGKATRHAAKQRLQVGIGLDRIEPGEIACLRHVPAHAGQDRLTTIR